MYLLEEFKLAQGKKQFSMHFTPLNYGSNVKDGMKTAMTLLSLAELSSLQAKIFKEIGEWPPRQASEWKTTLGEKNNLPKTLALNDTHRSSKSRRMVPPPDNLAQWANDSFHYCSQKVCDQASNDYDPSVAADDFVYLVSLCHLVLKVGICAASSADELIKNAVRQYYICQSHALATPRWGYVLPTFPFKIIIDAGGELQKMTYLAAKTCENAEVFASNLEGVKTIESLGKLVSQFITISRDEEISEANRETWCRSFNTAAAKINWPRLQSDKGKTIKLLLMKTSLANNEGTFFGG